MHMNSEQLIEKLNEELARPESAASEVVAAWKNVKHVVKIDRQWRMQGFMSFFMHSYELLRSVDSSLPVDLPAHLYDRKLIARLFRIPESELGISSTIAGPVGKPGRRSSTKPLADFALERRPQLTWKEISKEWKTIQPDQPSTPEKIREAYRRFYRGKNK